MSTSRKNNISKICILSLILVVIAATGCGNNEVYVNSEEVCIEDYDEKENDASEESGPSDALSSKEDSSNEISASSSDTTDEYRYVVYICGQVNAPGVYKVAPGTRVYEVLELAGGYTDNAYTDNINQAETVSDSQMIRVLSFEEKEQFEADGKIAEPGIAGISNESETDSKKVDLNRASREELMTLPGIGASKADSIIAYRNENGGFKSVEDLMKITGIKEGVFNKIREFVTVN